MSHFDVFNGDADGLCALHQLRLARPAEHAPDSVCVSGAKRDIALLARVDAQAGDSVTVLDISLEANRDALLALLARGVRVEYFDHHRSGPVPRHPLLQAHIDNSPTVCTGMLVDRYLNGSQRIWAAVAAFGDNFTAAARALLVDMALDAQQLLQLEQLGTCLNYNGYGDHESDLIIAPITLANLLRPYTDPFAFMREEPAFTTLQTARAADLAQTLGRAPEVRLACGDIHVLPDTPWSRRVRGEFGNQLTQARPEAAHAVLTVNSQGGYMVSVRAPQVRLTGADRVCRQFEGGGGRPAAAGINHLQPGEFEVFVRAFESTFSPD